MKPFMIAAGCLAAGIAGVAVAQDVVRDRQTESELRASWVTGSSLSANSGETVGTIDDLLLDEETGEVTGAVVQVGGFLGIGGKQIAVEWSELEFEYDASEVTIDLDRARAEEAPAFGFRERELPPPPEPADTTGAGTGTGTGSLQ